MQTNIYIYPAKETDAAAISAIEALCFSDAWSEGSVFSHVNSQYSLSFVARDECGECLGYILGSKIPPECELFRIATPPCHRRKKVAHRLLCEFISSAKNCGCDSFFIEVRQSNTPARALYSSFGFRETGTRRGYYTSPKEDAVLLFAAADDIKAAP